MYIHIHRYIIITGSEKTGIINHDSRCDFSSKTQSYMNVLSNFTVKTSLAYVVCFSWLLFPSPAVSHTSSLGP